MYAHWKIVNHNCKTMAGMDGKGEVAGHLSQQKAAGRVRGLAAREGWTLRAGTSAVRSWR